MLNHRIVLAGVAALIAAAATFAVHAAAVVQLSIRPQNVASALLEFSNQSKMQIVSVGADVRDRKSPGVEGQWTAEQALSRLLAGTGLSFELIDEKTARVFAVVLAAAGGPVETSVDESSGSGSTESAKESAQEIVVTGTHIRGAQPTSPVVTITSREMVLAGHHNLGDVIRALPQNFSGGQNPGVAIGASAGGISNQNVTGGSSLNLRGLGVDATLTLLNGTRLPYDGFTQATDVSVIPVAAIERMEVLLDGASAIYGSDAVGGVANIILKRDYRGVELSARYGAATEGGYAQEQYTAVAGTTWQSGGVLITGDFSRSDAVEARHRDYLSYMTRQDATIYPQNDQKGALFSGRQQLGRRMELSAEAFYTERLQKSFTQPAATSISGVARDSSIWGVAPAVSFVLPGEWSLRVQGVLGRNDADYVARTFSNATGAQTTQSRILYENEVQALGVESEGALFALPAGTARLSIGGGYRENGFDRINPITGASRVSARARSHYAYGEANFPLLANLSLNGALRYEDHDSFGETTTPKVGVLWEVAGGLDFKASWGKSFKVPTLLQQYQALDLSLLDPTSLGGTGYPAGSSVFVIQGGRSTLKPERAEILTAGLVFAPESLRGLRLELGWFDIDYTDRVATPLQPFNQGLTNPAFAPFVTLAPSSAQQAAAFGLDGRSVGTFNFVSSPSFLPYDPTRIVALVDHRNTNVSGLRMRGVDFSARHTVDLLGGSFTASGTGSWTTNSTRKLTTTSPEQLAVGILYFPAKFKGRIGAGWERKGLTLNSSVNHTGGIRNTNVNPNPQGDSMTTVDFIVDYQAQLKTLGDIGLNLAVINALDERPPYLAPIGAYLLNFDSTNYSALGRVISATVTKRF